MAKDTALLVASVRNEGPNILEWVAHHRLCGFDRIQIYQNDSTDTTIQTLRMLDRIGAIEYHDNRHSKGAHLVRAYRRAGRSAAFRDSTWCMALDTNEFLNITTGDRTVHALIDACSDEAASILVNRRVFGSNGAQDLSGKLVTERFTQAEPAAAIRDTVLSPFKTLFRTDTFGRPGIHMPRDPKLTKHMICNASGLEEGAFSRKGGRSLDPGGRMYAQVNHYVLRDLSDFLLEHAQAGADAPDNDRKLSYWKAHDRNEEEDLSLATRAFDIRAEMARLDKASDGKLMRLRQRALRQWRFALDQSMTDETMSALRDGILALSSEMPDPIPLKPPSHKTPVFRSVRARKEPDLPAKKTAALA